MKKIQPFKPIKAFLQSNTKAAKNSYDTAGFFKLPKKMAKPVKKSRTGKFEATPEENLVFKGGKTIRKLCYTNFYIGGKNSWESSDITNIDWALSQAMNDSQLNNVMRQYFGNKNISSKYIPSTILDGPKPKVFSEGNVKSLVADLFTNNQLKGFDLKKSVFCFLLPKGTILNTDKNAAKSKIKSIPFETDDSSIHGLGGYHGSVHVDSKTTIYYAVGVYSENLPNGKQNGIVAFKEPWKNIAATFYHELCEARTDPDVDDSIRTNNDKYCGWVSNNGAEVGDYPMEAAGNNLGLVMQEITLANGLGKVPVQFQYSNAVSGPEGPIKHLHKI